MSRVNPFENLDDFAPKPESKPVQHAQIDQLAADNGFPSRQAPRIDPVVEAPMRRARRRTTGRNQQLNIKATAATISRFYEVADKDDIALGELLDRALIAYEASRAR